MTTVIFRSGTHVPVVPHRTGGRAGGCPRYRHRGGRGSGRTCLRRHHRFHRFHRLRDLGTGPQGVQRPDPLDGADDQAAGPPRWRTRGTSKPSAPVAASTAWGLLAAAGRELERTFLNQYPTTNPTIATQTADGVVTGTLGATDPDGDRLVYTVVGKPSLGRVSIDQGTGDFTYTPVVDFASYGGTDAFTVSVSDDTAPHIHGLQGLLDAPIRLLRAVPFVGSLLSDYLPSTTTTATVKLTFDGSGTVAALTFPEGFRWGVSTAGFQSEMGGGAPLDVNSDWWQWTHDPFNKLLLGWKGAVPEDGPGAYTQYVTDANLASEGVGADTFRMSIEWSRIFPDSTKSVDISNGFTPEVLQQLDALANQDEVAHYRDQLDVMHAAGLDPMVTVNHFTLAAVDPRPRAGPRPGILRTDAADRRGLGLVVDGDRVREVLGLPGVEVRRSGHHLGGPERTGQFDADVVLPDPARHEFPARRGPHGPGGGRSTQRGGGLLGVL